MRIHRRSYPGGAGRMRGISMVELMVAMTLGLMILAGLATLFANTSAARTEMERNARQIENGRFAMELLGEDLRMAGFYGELNVSQYMTPAALPDVCSTDPAVWATSIPFAIQGFDRGLGMPLCIPAVRPNTDVVVIRRVSTCEAGTANCEPLVGNAPYVQVSKCSDTTPPENVATPFVLGLQGATPFPLRMKNCATAAGQRRYLVRIYFVSNQNDRGEDIPTLKRLDLTGQSWTETSLVEGIEELNIEYGIDWFPHPAPAVPDGTPDAYTTDPSIFATPGCTTCTPANNWANIVTARVNLLARNLEASPNYADTKTYSLGRDATGVEYTVTPGGSYRRHAYTGLVRVVNTGQRREKPP